MENEEFLNRIQGIFGEQEFSVAELVTSLFDEKPRSNDPRYRMITGKLRKLEKKGIIFSRKVGSLKRYCIKPYNENKAEKDEKKQQMTPDDYITIREMVIEGLKTGRIPLSALNRREQMLLDYIRENISRLIEQVRAPYEKILIRKTPTHIEIIPS